MTEQHPISPPPELVQQLRISSGTWLDQITVAYSAGADQELEACCRWIEDQLCMPPDARADVITQLNGSRRPTPPSLKEQALQILATHGSLTRAEADTIRQALEALPE